MAEQDSQVWGSLRYIFYPSILDENHIKEKYLNIDNLQVSEASKIREGLAGVIQGVQEEIGIENPLEATQEQRIQLINALKKDSQWFNSFSKILDLFDVDANPEVVIQNINRPWWNALQVNLADDNYDKNEYSFMGKISHSFISQLGDAGSKTRTQPKYDIQTKFQPVSISNLLFTSDDKLVLGYRAGQNFSDVIMTIPAGSAEPHLKRGAVWGSFDLEQREELNFDNTKYSSAEFVGVVTESLIAKGNWHYWIFRTKTSMNSDEVKTHWLTAVDRKEHSHLQIYDNDPEKLLDIMRDKFWDIKKANPNSYATTTEANKGTWVPQCSISVLGNCVQELGKDWARYADEKLQHHYDLTSWFNR